MSFSLDSSLRVFFFLVASSALVAAQQPASAGLVICAVYDMSPYTGIPNHYYAMIHDETTCDYVDSDETFATAVEDCFLNQCPAYTSAAPVSSPRLSRRPSVRRGPADRNQMYFVQTTVEENQVESEENAEPKEEQSVKRWPQDMRRIGQPGFSGRMKWSEAEELARTQDGSNGTKPLVEIEGSKVNIVRVEPDTGDAFYAYVFVAKLTDRNDIPIKQVVICEETNTGKKKCSPAYAWLAVHAALDPNTPANRLPGGLELLATVSAKAIPGAADYPFPKPYALRTAETDQLASMLVVLGRP